MTSAAGELGTGLTPVLGTPVELGPGDPGLPVDPQLPARAPLVGDPAERRLHRQVWADLRWAFRPPWNWLAGVVINLVLGALWLFVDPLHHGDRRAWAVIVGSYFAVWVLADVTTTNVLGADAVRVTARLRHGIPLRRILLVKNLTLLIIVGLPTLLLTGGIALVDSHHAVAVLFTGLGVLFPILTWLGIGNLVSVAMPVAALPLRQRWINRRDRWRTLRWGVALGLPYALYALVSPVSDLPRLIDDNTVLHIHAHGARAITMAVTGLAFWVLGTALGLLVARHRAVQFDDLPDEWREEPLVRTLAKIRLDLATLLRLSRDRRRASRLP